MSEARDFASADEAMAKDFKRLRAAPPSGFAWMASDLNPGGAVGDAANASAARGEACAEHGVAAFIELLADVLAFDLKRLARARWVEPAMGAPHFRFERALIADGHRYVVGVDEVGRGPLAGPVGVAAVILDPDDLPPGLDDLKALSAERREALSLAIYAKALAVTLVFASVEEIDAHNIRGATLAGDGAGRCGAEPQGRLRADRRARRAAGLALSGAGDHWRRWAVAVDRRRLDRRQGGARRVDDLPRRRAPRLWLCAARRLPDARSCGGAWRGSDRARCTGARSSRRGFSSVNPPVSAGDAEPFRNR